MRLLVLGGTRFVGRAVVEDALVRGWEVDALSRGQTGSLPEGARHLVGDREDPAQLRAALGDGTWDFVVDTWAMAPKVVATAVDALRGRVARYGYVSSESVYGEARPAGGDESAPVVDADPRADKTDYAADKRGGELAVLEAFPDAVLARAGMILGPHENVGRLPWWLTRMAAGGRVPAPGRPDRAIQYVDVRDLAAWLLDALASGVAGPCDLVCPSGDVTTRSLLEACIAATGSAAELVWVPQDKVLEAGAEPWIQLPCWVPETGEFAGFMEADTSRAVATGLRSRGVEATARDTWAWLQREPMTDFRGHGLPPELEQQLLATVEA